jgi:DNA-binding MarR family transcriptional regulator
LVQNELPPECLVAITEFDRLVHQPSRLSILALLSLVERAGFLHIIRQTGLTRGNLSSHVHKLESSGYVEVKKEFVGRTPRTFLRLTPQGREAFEASRQQMRQKLERLPE